MELAAAACVIHLSRSREEKKRAYVNNQLGSVILGLKRSLRLYSLQKNKDTIGYALNS